MGDQNQGDNEKQQGGQRPDGMGQGGQQQKPGSSTEKGAEQQGNRPGQGGQGGSQSGHPGGGSQSGQQGGKH